MSVNALLFQEQDNGLYKGIYVHYDGSIDGVGQVLVHAYSTYRAFQPIVEKASPLASLGLTTEMIPNDSKDARMMTLIQKNGLEWHKYTTLLSLEREYYVATSLDNLKEGLFYKYDHDSQIQGHTLPTREFLPYIARHESRTIYVQQLDGRWYIGKVNDDGRIKRLIQIYEK